MIMRLICLRKVKHSLQSISRPVLSGHARDPGHPRRIADPIDFFHLIIPSYVYK